MSAQTEYKPAEQEQETRRKKSRGTLLWVILAILIFFFILTSIILGSRLYDLATRDQYTVDLGVGELDGSIELFRIEYENELGEITVQGVNGENVVAPGTAVNYDIRLRNNDEMVIDFVMLPVVEFLTGDPVPVEFKIMDDYGNYILGNENTWVSSDEMNALEHRASIHPGEVFTYHVSWQWVFEVSEDQDAYDTFLGSQNGQILPGIRVGIETEAVANPYVTTKDVTHVTHLRGENFGCCWCCWLVWLLLLVCIVLMVSLWRLRRKYNEQVDVLDEYEAVLKAYGLLKDGELVSGRNG